MQFSLVDVYDTERHIGVRVLRITSSLGRFTLYDTTRHDPTTTRQENLVTVTLNEPLTFNDTLSCFCR
jgi:hypothetical protein